MRSRRKSSSGQAMVMVTFSLIAMAGLMGLAVDLGWSFFVQQEAQAAADGVAMAAAQEAYSGLNGAFGNITCGSSGITCQTLPVACSSAPAGNLADGCKYAAKNGFTDGQNRQKVTVQAQANSSPGTISIPGTVGTYYAQNVPYWVRAVAVQTVPQLFSAVLGNLNATVAASAVAGITGNSVPGSLVMLDQPGDCFDGGGSTRCGEDINVSCFIFCTISASGPIYLASTCHGATQLGCGNSEGASGTNYAGITSGFFGSGSVAGSAIDVQTPGAVTGGNWTCNGSTNNCPQQVSVSSVFLDPTTGESQPPLTATQPVATCGVYNGQLGGVTVGPYSYYAYTAVDGSHKPIPNGYPIHVSDTVTFLGSSTNCPAHGSDVVFNANGATAQSAAFPTYIFYGGMIFDSAVHLTTSFGPGQYVMVGTNPTNGVTGNCAGSVFCVNSALSLLSGDSTSGTMFIFTSPNSTSIGTGGVVGVNAYYPGLGTQINTNAVQRPEIAEIIAMAPNEGSVDVLALASLTTLTGVVQGGAAPTSLNQYNGVAFWQDRANSTVQYNATGHVQIASNGLAYQNPNPPPSGANGMSIVGFVAGVTVNGVIYQPRGAYLTDTGFVVPVNVTVQIISGAVYLSGLGTSLTLGTPTHLLTTYTASMIQ